MADSAQPYIHKAFKWYYQEVTTLPRDVTEIPTDLLTSAERRWNQNEESSRPVWIRTAYGPGTDARFEELLAGYGDSPDAFGYIANDAARYDLADNDEKALFAFFPFLLEAQAEPYDDDYYPDDSPEVQNALYMTDRQESLSEEERLTMKQEHYFIADDQAMRTGFIEWRMIDEFGHVRFRERIQPWSLQKATALKKQRSPQEFRDDIAAGHFGNDPKYSDTIVGPWDPPA